MAQSDFESNGEIYSMTGYGEARGKLGEAAVKVSLRTLNNEGTSVRVRGLSEDQEMAHKAEKYLKDAFPRGRIEASVETEAKDGLTAGELDREKIEASYAGLSELTKELGIPEGPKLADLIALELIETEPPYRNSWPRLKEVMEEAVTTALESQREEGKTIRNDMLAHLDEISAGLEEVEALVPEVVEGYRAELKERLTDLMQENYELDEGRLEQEVAAFADKVDVNEELSRAMTHVDSARKALEQGGVIGKKLEFLRQELQREINTLGAKSKDGEVQSIVIQMKSALGKFKEQSRNLA